MTKKSLLFIGIFLLIIGILIRKLSDLDILGLILILTGVACKTIYIIAKVKSGEYKPGKELIWLFLGLALFLTGLVLKWNSPGIISNALIVSGLSLKLLFILIFIRKVKVHKIILD
jgi:threonine/homoserine efflux transporter RhtA